MSIKLTLNNFKKYETKIMFDIPSTGLILLQGQSGIGKTSILDAIYFVLYGIGSKIVNFNSTSCSVTWEDENKFISRTKKPNRLFLKHQNDSGEFVSYEDAIAQELINRIYGSHFEITSYIKYKASTSFFSLGPSLRMEFLQKIAIKGTDVQVLKNITKEGIRNRKEKLIGTSSELNIVQKEFENLSIPKEVKFPFGKYNEVKIKNHTIRMKNLKIKLSNNEKKLKLTLQKQKQYELSKQQNFFIHQRVDDFKKEVLSLQRELLNMDFRDITEMENILKILQDNKSYLELQESIKSFQMQLKDYKWAEDDQKRTELKRLKSIATIEDKSDFYKSNVIIQKDILTIQDRLKINKEKYKNLQHADSVMLDNLNIQLNNSIGKKFVCPNCNCDVLLLNDKLQNFTNIGQSDTTLLKSQIQCLKEELKQKENLSSSIESDIKFLQENKEFDIEKNYQDILINHLEQLKIQEQVNNEIDKLNKSSYSQSVKMLEIQITKLQKQLLGIKFSEIIYPEGDIDTLKLQITIQKGVNDSINILENKINKLQSSIKQENNKIVIIEDEDFREEISSIETQINELKSQLSQSELQDKQLVEYLSYIEKRDYYNKWKNKCGSLQEMEKNSVTSLKVAENFLTILNNTESKAVFNIINILNINLKYYSEQFFTEPISIQVQPYKENQSGNIKPSVVIKVIYKGIEYDIDCLSGGETSRVELAICLAINNIINGKILLLDEVLGTLNSEYIEMVTNILKEEAVRDNKLILTILHGASEGNFDHVINI